MTPSNDVILNELQKQNKEYLTKIIEQNETIIQNQKKILERLTTDWYLLDGFLISLYNKYVGISKKDLYKYALYGGLFRHKNLYCGIFI